MLETFKISPMAPHCVQGNGRNDSFESTVPFRALSRVGILPRISSLKELNMELPA
jgi:hypothetical protein